MKKTFLMITILFIVSCSVEKNTVLKNNIYISTDPLKISSLHFLNDSICIYSQEFLKPINVKYQKTDIVCSYTVKKDKIILRYKQSPEFLKNVSCFLLPDSIRNTYECITTIPPSLCEEKLLYGYINSIEKADTLLFYNGRILYHKLNECSGFNVPVDWLHVFLLPGTNETKKDSRKEMRTYRSRKMPRNNNY